MITSFISRLQQASIDCIEATLYSSVCIVFMCILCVCIVCVCVCLCVCVCVCPGHSSLSFSGNSYIKYRVSDGNRQASWSSAWGSGPCRAEASSCTHTQSPAPCSRYTYTHTHTLHTRALHQAQRYAVKISSAKRLSFSLSIVCSFPGQQICCYLVVHLCLTPAGHLLFCTASGCQSF